MSFWLALVVIAQFLMAIVALIDKYIVTAENAIPKPLVYAFYVCALSALSIFIFFFSWIPVPFFDITIPSFANIEFPTLLIALLALVAGYSLFQALVSLFSALRESDASDVVPVVGAVSALGTFLLSYLFLGTTLSPYFFLGFISLIVGTLLMSHFRFTWHVGFLSLHAGMFFAIHYMAVKVMFVETSFDNGFFWSRMGIVFIAFSVLLVPRAYAAIRHQTGKTGTRGGVLVLLNKVIAGLASILLLKAIDLGDVAVVQALGGLQYVFLLMISIFMGSSLTYLCGEKCGHHEILHRSFAISFIVLGFFLLFL